MFSSTRASVLASSAVALALFAAGASPAVADNSMDLAATNVAAGNVLVCDTPQEVEAVLTSTGADLAARIGQANQRFGADACGVVTAIFYKGDETKTVVSQDGAVRIIQVDLIGLRAGDAWLRMLKPASKYAGVLENSTEIDRRSQAEREALGRGASMIPAIAAPALAVMRVNKARSEAGAIPMVARLAEPIAACFGRARRERGDRQGRRSGGDQGELAHVSSLRWAKRAGADPSR